MSMVLFQMRELDTVSDPHPPYPYDSYLVGPNEDRQRNPMN